MQILDKIIDFEFTIDKFNLVNQGSESISSSKTDVTTATTLTLAANLASLGDGGTDALIHWFIHEDNTYVVEELSLDAIFQNGVDIIIKLQGIIDMQGLNIASFSFS